MKPIPTGYFAVIFQEKQSGTFGVRYPDMPGIVTFGQSFDEAVENADEALHAALETDFDRDQPLPDCHKPKPKKGEKIAFIALEPEIWVAYLLRSWRERFGMSQKQLAGKLDISFQAYQRMERPGRSNLTVSTLQRIARVFNKELVFDVRDARAA